MLGMMEGLMVRLVRNGDAYDLFKALSLYKSHT